MAELELIKALEEERDKLLKKVSSIEQTILVMQQSYVFEKALHSSDGSKSSALGISISNTDYPFNKSIKLKIAYILKKEQRFLHVREIAEVLNKFEPGTSLKDFRDKASQGLSQLKNVEGSNVISVKIGNQNQNNFWGSKDWLNEDGSIKDEYKYNENYLVENSNKETISI